MGASGGEHCVGGRGVGPDPGGVHSPAAVRGSTDVGVHVECHDLGESECADERALPAAGGVLIEFCCATAS